MTHEVDTDLWGLILRLRNETQTSLPHGDHCITRTILSLPLHVSSMSHSPVSLCDVCIVHQ